MADRPAHGTLVSDFNIEPCLRSLVHDREAPRVTAIAAPYGQVISSLMNPDLECWRGEPGFAVVWTRPEAVVPTFQRLIQFHRVDPQNILDEVDQFSALLLGLAQRIPTVMVPTWTAATGGRGLGMLDLQPGIGVADALMRMNLRLADNLRGARGAYLLDANRWMQHATPRACNPASWFLAKIPYSSQVFREAASDFKATLRGVAGLARRLVVVDLDDTLWGGTLGDAGVSGIRLGGHDHVGEAFVDFQRALKALTRRGILLGIVSKNEELTALHAIRSHPEMVLREDDFAGWRINWEDKARNLLDLVGELRLGLESVVFIDDNPAERSRVAGALPEVLVPEWPANKLHAAAALQSLTCFDTPSFTVEDASRAAMYVAERERAHLKRDLGSVDDWLDSLQITVRIEHLHEANLPRAAQLLNKTNQMNLTTRRLAENELRDWAAAPAHALYVFRVSDRLGDSGLTGLLGLVREAGEVRIVDFVLSCRVMGRRVEETMLHAAARFAAEVGAGRLTARYLPTPRNRPCLDFLGRSGLRAHPDHEYVWSVSDGAYPLPSCVTLVDERTVAVAP